MLRKVEEHKEKLRQRRESIARELLFRPMIELKMSHEYCKVLSDVSEGVFGALFVDCGSDLEHVWARIRPLILPAIEELETPDQTLMHPRSILIAWTQAKECKGLEFKYEVKMRQPDADALDPFSLITSGYNDPTRFRCEVFVHHLSLGRGTGKNRRQACARASARAVRKMRKAHIAMQRLRDEGKSLALEPVGDERDRRAVKGCCQELMPVLKEVMQAYDGNM